MAIVTSKFRVAAASSFSSLFGTDSMYLLLGRPQSWDNTLSTNFAEQTGSATSDLVPPNPVDNTLNEMATWRDAMAAVRVTGGQTKLAIARNNWTASTRYDMYRHDINAARATATGKFNLSESNMIVYNTSNSSVYKCLYNGSNAQLTTGTVSTVAPTTTALAPQTTADGYIWKYLYTINAADADFITNNYIPVRNDTSSVSSVNGIDVIVVDNGGSYSSIPTVTIFGDGTGAAATAITSAGVITKITVTAAGSGYTWAKVRITAVAVNTPASSTAIIAPAGGHGANLINECMAHNVMIAGSVESYQGNDVPVSQDFRTIAIVRNPLEYQTSSVAWTTSTVATATTKRITRTLVMTSTATTAPANDITLTNTSGSLAIAVFQSSGTVNLQYIQPIAADSSILSTAEINRIDTSTTLSLKQYANGDIITGTAYSQAISNTTTVLPELQPYSGQILYMDYRQPITRNLNQNEKINIVINF
jgi:hypothetical protein